MATLASSGRVAPHYSRPTVQARGASLCCPLTSAICTLGQNLVRCPRTTLEVGWWLHGFRRASSTVLVQRAHHCHVARVLCVYWGFHSWWCSRQRGCAARRPCVLVVRQGKHHIIEECQDGSAGLACSVEGAAWGKLSNLLGNSRPKGLFFGARLLEETSPFPRDSPGDCLTAFVAAVGNSSFDVVAIGHYNLASLGRFLLGPLTQARHATRVRQGNWFSVAIGSVPKATQ